jgi:hypothetical protein
MEHACKNCVYFYETTSIESITVYNPLLDGLQTLSIKTKSPACGVSPGGILLDKESPICEKYKEA